MPRNPAGTAALLPHSDYGFAPIFPDPGQHPMDYRSDAAGLAQQH